MMASGLGKSPAMRRGVAGQRCPGRRYARVRGSRVIAVLAFPDVAYMRGILYLFSDHHQKWPRTNT